MPTLQPPPLQTPIVESPKTGIIAKAWAIYLRALGDRLDVAAARIAAVALTALAAAIGTTALAPAAGIGVYKVSWYLRITRAAGTSSSVTVTIGATDGGVAVSQSGSAVTGNTTSTIQSGSVVLQADAGALSYSTAYASVGAPSALYALNIIVERIG